MWHLPYQKMSGRKLLEYRMTMDDGRRKKYSSPPPQRHAMSLYNCPGSLRAQKPPVILNEAKRSEESPGIQHLSYTNALPAVPVRPVGLFFPRQSIGIGDLLEQGEDASHKPGLPLPALAGWGAGRAVSGEPRWFVVNPSGFPVRPEERRVISRPDGAVGFWGCAVPRNIVPRWGTTN